MLERMLVGTDGSLTATLAVEAAGRVARAHRSELIIGHAFAPRPTAAQQRASDEAPEEPRWRLSVGEMAESTVQTAIELARDAAGAAVPVSGRCEPGHPVPVCWR